MTNASLLVFIILVSTVWFVAGYAVASVKYSRKKYVSGLHEGQQRMINYVVTLLKSKGVAASHINGFLLELKEVIKRNL